MTFNNIVLNEPQPGVWLLTINRPDVLNALNLATLQELDAAVSALKDNDSARVLCITGSGSKAFVAGADIEFMSHLSPLEGKAFAEQGLSVLRKLETLSLPVIALVNGYALGGGCELAMACDFILASDNARFGQPEINLGITPGFGGSQRLVRLVGRAKALELLYTGQMLDSNEALQCGLINRSYPQDRLLEEGLKLASEIASKSKSALSLSKQLVQRGQDLDLENACIMESDIFGLSFATDDRKEGMAAFLENRKPDFNTG